MRRSDGFTLIELLVAIALFAVISAVSYGTLLQVGTIRDRLVSEHEQWSRLTIAFQRLADDLAHARTRTVRDVRGDALPAFTGQPSDPRPLAPAALELTRGGEWGLMDAPRPNLTRVAWRLHEGKLVRETWPALDRAPGAEAAPATMLNGVESFELRFFHPASGWRDRWPVPESGAVLPAGVEVTLVRRNAAPLVRTFAVNE